MRFRYEEYSPQNKKQYVIAVGVHELRALFDAAKAVSSISPERTVEQREFKTALQTSMKGLKEAIKYAEEINDDGKRRKPYVGIDKDET
jgi:hypothetical protein